MPPEQILDPLSVDTSRILIGKDVLREWNPQRFEMEQVDAIVYMDRENHIVVGYRDIHDDEFWCRGHMPGRPIFPGVLMCEIAAQICAFYTRYTGVIKHRLLGFGGMNEVRFRSLVQPGDRLVIICKGKRLNPRQTIFEAQGFVGKTMAFQAEVIGVPLPDKGG